MAKFTFTDPDTGKQYSVTAPEGATFEQAEAVFQKQLGNGSLLGLKPGSSLSAASQLTGGLTSALSQVTQAASGIAGSVNGVIQGALNKTNLSASALPGGLGGIANAAKSVASQTLNGITNAAKGFSSPTDGIGLTDFAKQVPAIGKMIGMDTSQVTATLSQASKIVGQASGAISNTLGVGKFGLDGSQLEAAGMIKPGTVSSLLSTGTNSLTSVLKSPTVWTGKDGIKSLDGLLNSVPSQDKIQQSLMSTGLAGVKELGIPVDKLNPGAISGLAMNAAKSIPNTFGWAKGAALPPSIKAAFDKASADGSFAVKFADTKVDDAMKQIAVPVPAVDTTNRTLIDAAAKRIVGNNKIPETSYTSPPPNFTADSVSQKFDQVQTDFGDVNTRLQVVLSNNHQQYAAIARDVSALRTLLGDAEQLDGSALGLIREAKLAEDDGLVAAIEGFKDGDVSDLINTIKSSLAQLKQELAKASA